jgi:hypothetical protein
LFIVAIPLGACYAFASSPSAFGPLFAAASVGEFIAFGYHLLSAMHGGSGRSRFLTKRLDGFGGCEIESAIRDQRHHPST